MSLPVLADPFWGRAAFPVTSRCGETASIRLVSAELRSAWTAEGSCPYADGQIVRLRYECKVPTQAELGRGILRRVYVRGDPRRWKAVSCCPGRRDPDGNAGRQGRQGRVRRRAGGFGRG